MDHTAGADVLVKSDSKKSPQKTTRKKAKSAAKPSGLVPPDGKLSGGAAAQLGQDDVQKMMARATAEANAAFGTIVSLMVQSEAHQLLFLQDLKWSVVPPLMHRQFRLFRVKGIPCGYLTWATVSEEVEERILTGQVKLQPGDWVSGDHPWVMDVLLPPQLPEAMVPMITEPFDDPAAVKLLMLDDEGQPTAGDLMSFLQERRPPAPEDKT